MHGLVNRSIEEYLRAAGGESLWSAVAEACAIDPRGFQAIRHYPDALTHAMLAEGAARLDHSEDEFLEDMGAWLAQVEPLRRLLRFSGTSYADFLAGLEQLPGRFEMVVPSFGLPSISVESDADGSGLTIRIGDRRIGWSRLLAGLLRRMADDYGALALISDEQGRVRVQVPEHGFAEGRRFDIGRPVDVAAGMSAAAAQEARGQGSVTG